MKLEEAVYLADEILLLTRRPTRIAERISFDAPRPRTPATLSEERFVHTKAVCVEIFQQEVGTGRSATRPRPAR
jgi:NitT/TauT family transport system ATP-binding protein